MVWACITTVLLGILLKIVNPEKYIFFHHAVPPGKHQSKETSQIICLFC